MKFPMSHEWLVTSGLPRVASLKWLATSDRWGILPILSIYPSFNNIPDRKVETCKEQFLQNYGNFFKTVGKKYFLIVSPLMGKNPIPSSYPCFNSSNNKLYHKIIVTEIK